MTSVGGACGTATGDSTTINIAIGGAATQNGTATCTAGAWSHTLGTPLSADGAYTATATQADTASNTGTSGAKAITVDKATPVVTLTTVNGGIQAFPLTTNATISSVGGACGTASGDSTTIMVIIGGAGSENGSTACIAGAWTYTLLAPGAADGAYTATATQADAATNTGTSGPKAITVDKTAPAVTLTTVNGAPQTFPFSTNVTVTAVGGACGTAAGDSTTINVTIGGAGSESGTATCTAGAWTRTLTTPLSVDGSYTATATQADGATNTGTSGAKAITVDKGPPVVTLTTVNGATQTFPFTTNATVTAVGGACGTAAGDSTTVNVTIGGAGSESGTATCVAGAWSRTLTTPLSVNGAYTATATQADNLANVGTSGAKAITVDKTAPAVTLTTVNGAAQTFPLTTNATISSVGGACGTASGDSTTVIVAIGGAGSENGSTACIAGAWTYTLLAPGSANGTYTATATQADERDEHRYQRPEGDHRRQGSSGGHADHRQRRRANVPALDQRHRDVTGRRVRHRGR